MEYAEIIEAIGREGGGLPADVAQRAAQAVLQTLAERLPSGEARHILAELPAELKPYIYTEADAEGFGIDEFLERLANREGTDDVDAALRHARAVFAELGRALDADAVAHLAASLPRNFEPLVAEAQHRLLDIMPAEEFWRRAGQRLGLDQETARRVTEAVLETLAERIAAGEVEDLIARLHPLLHPPLRRGVASSGSAARRMPAQDFLRRVARREGPAGRYGRGRGRAGAGGI
ncbi:MAG TPA: DUF2267 domain-containing protein, partial [Opitutaceae bacterium]|nr:DUF2267 domain-containing protein [Opitutaceae bacterium]